MNQLKTPRGVETKAPRLGRGVEVVTDCRVCGEEKLEVVLDLGEQAIGNAFRLATDPPAAVAPLVLKRCTSCSLVQLGHRVDEDLMYERYWYRSGVNRTMTEHLADLAEQAVAVAEVEPGDVVLDIGCNDGTLLDHLPSNTRRVGVDPSNIVPTACDEFVNDYFSAAAVEEAMGGRRAKLITSIAMFYDLNDPRAFAREVRSCLREDGVWILELAYLPTMLESVSFDTICHEHVCYYRLATLHRVLGAAGLEMFDVEFNDCNGGSFRVFVAPRGQRRPTPRLGRAKLEEAARLYDTRHPYVGFRHRVELVRRHVRRFIDTVRGRGQTIWGYGASTKGQVTLQYCGITPDEIVAIAERNPDKVGLLTPGTGIPIRSERELRDAHPDWVLVLPWHFIDEFKERERDYLESGGRFVVPLPAFHVVSAKKNGG